SRAARWFGWRRARGTYSSAGATGSEALGIRSRRQRSISAAAGLCRLDRLRWILSRQSNCSRPVDAIRVGPREIRSGEVRTENVRGLAPHAIQNGVFDSQGESDEEEQEASQGLRGEGDFGGEDVPGEQQVRCMQPRICPGFHQIDHVLSLD